MNLEEIIYGNEEQQIHDLINDQPINRRSEKR